MIKIFLQITAFCLLVISFFLAVGILTKKPIEYKTESKVWFSIPIGLDSNGLPAACTEDGLAQDIIMKKGITAKDIRKKNGKQVECMPKKKAEKYLIKNGITGGKLRQIIDQYPPLKTH